MKRFFAIILTLALILTTIPLALNAAAADETAVTVSVDGVDHTAHIGDVILYTYYFDFSQLDIGEGSGPNRITEFEGGVFYQKSGLKLLTPLEDEEGDHPVIPKLSGNIVVSDDSAEALHYNGFSINGFLFKQKKIFLQMEFEITGSEDLYIENHLKNLGSGEVKMIYEHEVFVAPTYFTEVEVTCPHVAPTDAPTEAPTTAPTDAPTDAPTAAPTEAPTDAPTAAPTEAPTTAPTNAPTNAPTEAPTEPPLITLQDYESGVILKTYEDVSLSVEEIEPLSLDYVLSGGAKANKIYDICLIRNGKRITPQKPVILTLRSKTAGAAVYSFADGQSVTPVTTEAETVFDKLLNRTVYMHTFTTDKLGRFIISVSDPLVVYIRGDVDMDHQLLILDATAIQRWLTDLCDLNEQQILNGDFDRDGKTTILDATAIQRSLVGLDYQVYN